MNVTPIGYIFCKTQQRKHYLFSSKKEKSTSGNKMKKVKKTTDNKGYTYEQKERSISTKNTT
jgi:hypothetical protein